MGKLVLLQAGGKTREVRLDRERITIGRRADNDVCLPYPAVSSEHAAVVTVLADSFLEDLDSTNGTLVNGRPIARHLLRDRDRIDIGQQELIYLEDESGVLEPTPQQLGRFHTAVFGERVDTLRSQPIATAGSPLAVDAGPALALRVLTGPLTDQDVPLVQDETVIGRAGVQVAAIRRSVDGIRVVPLEGRVPPSLNGLPLRAEGQPLVPGDVLEIAGTKLRLIALAGTNA